MTGESRDRGSIMSEGVRYGHRALTRDGTLTGKTVETVKQKEFIVESRRAETPRAESTPALDESVVADLL